MGWRSARSIDSTGGLGQEIQTTDPGVTLYYIGDESHQSGTSDHNPCDCHDVVCAVDVMQNNGPNLDELAEHIRQRVLAGDQRTKYLIWDRRIFSGHGADYPPGVWRTYTGSNPHTDHVHLSVRHGPSLYDDQSSWGWTTEEDDMPLTDDDIDRIVKAVEKRLAVHFGAQAVQNPESWLNSGLSVRITADRQRDIKAAQQSSGA